MNILNGFIPSPKAFDAILEVVEEQTTRHHGKAIMAGHEEDGNIFEAFDNCVENAESYEHLLELMRLYVVENFQPNARDEYERNGVSRDDF